MDTDTESYLLLLLADGNLPTGSFVASSGLESFVKHGFFGLSRASASSAHSLSSLQANLATINFIRDNLASYARSALPFVADAHSAMEQYRFSFLLPAPAESSDSERDSNTLNRLSALDELYEAMTLNDVMRRASKAQGVALLSLFSKGFTKPLLPSDYLSTPTDSEQPDSDNVLRLIDRYKLLVRREETHGHLPVCWGALTAALGLGLERSQYLHLFLQARSLLSASIRLNVLGPYAAQQILLHAVRGVVDENMRRCQDLRTGLKPAEGHDRDIVESIDFCANTWPLGEILASTADTSATPPMVRERDVQPTTQTS